MRLIRPRYTILGLMIAVLLAILAMTCIAVRRDQHRSALDSDLARAEYQNARLTREVAD